MSNNTILEFYEALGFEETETDDGLIVFGIELTQEGSYALLTDAEGTMPKNATQEIIFAYYTPDDSFLWSASFKNSAVFKELWTGAQTAEARVDAIVQYRKEREVF
ncbi:hypothetical protein [Sporomusa malonica]|uniref:Uncharacterized protein n=1 Tax=Sporomusa malonica TaxID=112901 RepID=A0A1W2BVD3_9FIRM|nr:hypothetical protein [Sporomusa malonica]SMC76694.1 hypothetical protein SAMN04488500_108176 [Sporomusa malonica]